MHEIIDHLDLHGLLEMHNLSALNHVPLVNRADRYVAKVKTLPGWIVVKVDPDFNSILSEATNNQRLHDLGLPVADMIGHGDSPIPYIILSWIDGTAISQTSPPAVLEEVGAVLRRIHNLRGNPPYAGNETWDAWMEGWLYHALPWWEKSGFATAGDIEQAWTQFRIIQPLLTSRGHSIIFFDGRPAHFIVRNNKLVGLIDLEEMRSGDALMDFGVFSVLHEHLVPGLLKGYNLANEEARLVRKLVPFYQFLRRLAAAEWTLQHENPALASSILSSIKPPFF